MEENKSSLTLVGSNSLVRAENSIAIANKLLLERNNRDRLEAEYHYHLGIKRKPWETLTAIEDFTNAIKLDPTNSLYYSERGLYKRFVSDLEGSIIDYEKAITIKPTSGLYVTVGDLRASNDEYEKAVIEYTRAATITPEAAEVYYKRGMARTNLKYYEEAIDDYTKAIECQKANCPSNEDAWGAYYQRGVIKLHKHDYKGAIEDFNKSFDLSSKFYIPVDETELALNDLGLAMYYIQDYAGAIESFTGAIWHGERYGAKYNYRTEPNSVLPENSSVKTDFTQNVFPLPYKSLANSYYNRGIVKRLLKDDEGSESDFSRANWIQSLAKTSSTP